MTGTFELLIDKGGAQVKKREEQHINMPTSDPIGDTENKSIDEDDQQVYEGDANLAEDSSGDSSEKTIEETPLETATRQAAEYLDALQRLMAEFDNYRKRMAKERQRLAEVYQATVLQAILPALDSFDAALQQATTGVSEDSSKGLAMIYSALMSSLGKLDFQKMNLLNSPFDPELAEAIMIQPVANVEPGMVIGEISTGYRFKGNVLRPARVVVSAEAQSPGAPSDTEPGK